MATVGKDQKNYPISISYLRSGVLIARLATCLTALLDSCSMLKEVAKRTEKSISAKSQSSIIQKKEKRKQATCEKLKFPLF